MQILIKMSLCVTYWNYRRIIIEKVELPQLYNGPRPITKAKKKDMLDLLLFIPPVYHAYFQELLIDESLNNDIGPLNDTELEED